MMRKVFVFVLMMWLAFAPAIFNPVVSAAHEVNSPEFLAAKGISESKSVRLPVNPPAGQEDNAGLGSSMKSPEAFFAQMGQPPQTHTIYLKSREFVPGIADAPVLDLLASPDAGRVHLLVQLDFIPRQVAKDALVQNQGTLLETFRKASTGLPKVSQTRSTISRGANTRSGSTTRRFPWIHIGSIGLSQGLFLGNKQLRMRTP